MKLRLLAATLAALTLGSSVTLAQTATAPAATAPVASEKATLSYALGYQTGRDLAETKADLEITTIIRALQDGYAKRDPAMPGEKLGAALKKFQEKMAAQERAEYERVMKDNKAKSDVFLASNRTKPGITALPGGLQYRVIEAGTGAKPTNASTVQVHYRGSVSTGQEFANTYAGAAKPNDIKLSELTIAGLKEAILMMPTGSRWEVFMPAEKAFGNDPRSPIGPGQAVVFDVKLISVK